MTEIVVRPYRAEDFSQVVEIAVNLLVEDKEIEYWICLACESDRYELFAGEIDTKVVGLLMLELTGLHKNLAEIHGIAVPWECQRKGYGSTPMKGVERYARDRGVVKMHVAVNMDNKIAIPFYIKNGYIPRGVLSKRGRPPTEDDCLILDKRL